MQITKTGPGENNRSCRSGQNMNKLIENEE